MSQHKPYVVRYKGDKNHAIAPGIHGRFESLHEAETQAIKCKNFFGGGEAAKVWIWTDQAALTALKEEQGECEEQYDMGENSMPTQPSSKKLEPSGSTAKK